MPESVWMDPFLDASLHSEPLTQRAHVTVPERLAFERAEEGVAAGEPKALAPFEPAVHRLGRVRGERGRALPRP